MSVVGWTVLKGDRGGIGREGGRGGGWDHSRAGSFVTTGDLRCQGMW